MRYEDMTEAQLLAALRTNQWAREQVVHDVDDPQEQRRINTMRNSLRDEHREIEAALRRYRHKELYLFLKVAVVVLAWVGAMIVGALLGGGPIFAGIFWGGIALGVLAGACIWLARSFKRRH